MIRFDISKLHIEHMYIKMVSSALGGMITVVDEKKSKKAKREVFRKIKIPHQLARHFKKQYTVSKYLKPVLSAVTFYRDHVVAIERHPLGNLGKKKTQGLFGEVDWFSESETMLDTVLMPLDKRNEFFIDGTFLYTIEQAEVKKAIALSKDGRFKAVKVKSYKLMNLHLKQDFREEERTSLAFTPRGGKTFMTPPIWKTLSNVGTSQLSKRLQDDLEEMDDSVDVSSDSTFKFDEIDQHLSVNLGFALKAGRELSEVFGYDMIEPLGLDDLMLQMRSVNLPNIANEVKQTYDTGFPFTHAVAWLIGLVNRTKSLDSFITLRSLLKHLTTKGVYRKGAFDSDSIFKDPNVLEVPPLTIEEAGALEKIDMDTALQMGRIARKIAADGTDFTGEGGMYDAV